MIAERAGVQRHTVYAHLPDERSILMACSGLHAEQHPPPDAAPWRAIADRRERLANAKSTPALLAILANYLDECDPTLAQRIRELGGS